MAETNSAARPNVLFIAVDDLNHWVRHLGRNPQAQTLNLDRLAARGVTFTHAYAAVPACEPSRCSLLTGRRAWTTACYYNGDNWKTRVPEGGGLNAQFLKAGYYVAGAGKVYHGAPFASEWSEYMSGKEIPKTLPQPGKDEGFHVPVKLDLQDDDLSDWHTVNWCIKRLEAKRDQPFFIACGLVKPHLPFAVPRKYYELFPRDGIQLPPYLKDDLKDIPPAGVNMAIAHGDHEKILAENRWKDAIQSYLAACAYTDMNVGRLLDALDKSPARTNTIIVLWGDHGWSFGEKDHWRKFALWEEPTRAPLIWVAPGVTPPGGVCARTVDFMTVYPTLCELAGLPIPEFVAGPSAVSLLRDPKAAWSHPAITTHGYMNHTVRTEQWRYIRYADGGEELYDETKDPYEWTNLAPQTAFAPVKTELAAFLPKDNKPPVKLSKAEKKKTKTSDDE
ncbi:MAG: sulfatase [Verrucomicrobia bacterium]|nr:sulfatase [Verrucomicrobiota bacterium]